MAGAAPGYGKTCRQDVLRGVVVPVVPGAAGRARPVPRIQAQVDQEMPARRARPGRGVPPAGRDHAPPVSGGLVLDHGPEGAPPAVTDRLSQRAVADHVLHGEVFQDDHVVAADQAGAGLVEEVGAGGADFPVGPGDLGPGLGAVRGPLLAAGHAPLAAGSGSGPGMSTASETYQRPHGSRDTVTVAGSIVAGSMPGQDQVNASGVSIFARNSAPSRHRNPDRVYSADCRPCRDLNRGHRARLAKNAVYAACWWRIACCNGTCATWRSCFP